MGFNLHACDPGIFVGRNLYRGRHGIVSIRNPRYVGKMGRFRSSAGPSASCRRGRRGLRKWHSMKLNANIASTAEPRRMKLPRLSEAEGNGPTEPCALGKYYVFAIYNSHDRCFAG